jgi:hypothetical protein
MAVRLTGIYNQFDARSSLFMILCGLMMATLRQPKHAAEIRKNICCVFDGIPFFTTEHNWDATS